MPQLVKVGALYKRLGEEAVNEIAEWLDAVYDAKAVMAALRRDMKEVPREVREIRLTLNQGSGRASAFMVHEP